jgi:hypothetical protein
MAIKKLRVQKFFKGAQADARAGKAAMSPSNKGYAWLLQELQHLI